MREIGVKELKASLSEALRTVESGERVTVTRHGRPVAELGPPSRAEETPDQHMRRLIADGAVTPATKPAPTDAPTPIVTGKSASDFILAEREAER